MDNIDETKDEYDYIIIPVEISSAAAQEINEKCPRMDKENLNNPLIHTWHDAEIFGKEK